MSRTFSRRSSIAVSCLCALVLAGACGAGSGVPSSRVSESTSVSPAPASPSPSPSGVPTYPNLERFAEPFDRFAYQAAFDDCRLLGVTWTAEGFGGNPGDPRSVARAYARAMLSTAGHRDATFQGCLDGFDAATP